MAQNTLLLVGTDLLRAEKLSHLYGVHTVQVKEVSNSVVGTLVVITARPQHREFFDLLTCLYEALICEYGFRITQNLQTETSRLFMQLGR